MKTRYEVWIRKKNGQEERVLDGSCLPFQTYDKKLADDRARASTEHPAVVDATVVECMPIARYPGAGATQKETRKREKP